MLGVLSNPNSNGQVCFHCVESSLSVISKFCLNMIREKKGILVGYCKILMDPCFPESSRIFVGQRGDNLTCGWANS